MIGEMPGGGIMSERNPTGATWMDHRDKGPVVPHVRLAHRFQAGGDYLRPASPVERTSVVVGGGDDWGSGRGPDSGVAFRWWGFARWHWYGWAAVGVSAASLVWVVVEFAGR